MSDLEGVGFEVVGVGEAEGGAGGGEEHGVGVEAEAEVGLTVPVLEVVAGAVARAGKVRDLVLGDARGFEAGAGELVEGGGFVVGRERGDAVTEAGGEGFAAETGVFVDFEEIEAEVRDAGGDGLLDGVEPGGFGLVGKAGDEIEAEVGDAGAADAVDLGATLIGGMETTDGGGLLIDEALDAEGETVDAVALEGFEGAVGELAGGGLEGDLGIGRDGEGALEVMEEGVDLVGGEQAGCAAAEVEGVDQGWERGADADGAGGSGGDLVGEGVEVGGKAAGGEAVGGEVAEGALGAAERDGDVEADGGGHGALLIVGGRAVAAVRECGGIRRVAGRGSMSFSGDAAGEIRAAEKSLLPRRSTGVRRTR